MEKHLIFDTETTGLWRNTLVALEKQPEIFETYGYRIDPESFEEIDEMHFFSKPTKKMEAGAKKATGKDDSFMVDFPPFKDNALKWKKYIESSDAVVCHNAVYDVTVCNFEFARLGMEIKWPRVICTVESSEWIHGYRLSLTALHEFLFDEKFTGAHEAKTDVHALGRCYIELIKRGWI